MDWTRELAETVSKAREALKQAAQQAQAEAWKLSQSDVLFLKAIKIKP